MIARFALGAALGLALSTAAATGASAQSYNAPAGIPAATAPGGLVGLAGPGNVQRYIEGDSRYGTVTVEGVYETGSIHRAPRAERWR